MGLDCLLWASTMHSDNGSIILCTVIIIVRTYSSFINREVGSVEVKFGRQLLNIPLDPRQNRSP